MTGGVSEITAKTKLLKQNNCVRNDKRKTKKGCARNMVMCGYGGDGIDPTTRSIHTTLLVCACRVVAVHRNTVVRACHVIWGKDDIE